MQIVTDINIVSMNDNNSINDSKEIEHGRQSNRKLCINNEK